MMCQIYFVSIIQILPVKKRMQKNECSFKILSNFPDFGFNMRAKIHFLTIQQFCLSFVLNHYTFDSLLLNRYWQRCNLDFHLQCGFQAGGFKLRLLKSTRNFVEISQIFCYIASVCDIIIGLLGVLNDTL